MRMRFVTPISNLPPERRQQEEQMSANIAQFRYEEYGERLVASMRGEGGQHPVRRKWVMLGQQAKVFFRRSPALTYMYGALDTTPPPKEPKSRDSCRLVGCYMSSSHCVI